MVECSRLVATSVALTVAPGTAAPEGSVTVPLIDRRKVCALAGRTNASTNKSATSRCFILSHSSHFFVCKHRGVAARRCTAPAGTCLSNKIHHSFSRKPLNFFLKRHGHGGPQWPYRRCAPPGVGRDPSARSWGVLPKTNFGHHQVGRRLWPTSNGVQRKISDELT